ncbi:hypothetical protein [Caudoviricetes sp.]|nr:hypothetical protein [Caudoviricetes sp.]
MSKVFEIWQREMSQKGEDSPCVAMFVFQNEDDKWPVSGFFGLERLGKKKVQEVIERLHDKDALKKMGLIEYAEGFLDHAFKSVLISKHWWNVFTHKNGQTNAFIDDMNANVRRFLGVDYTPRETHVRGLDPDYLKLFEYSEESPSGLVWKCKRGVNRNVKTRIINNVETCRCLVINGMNWQHSRALWCVYHETELPSEAIVGIVKGREQWPLWNMNRYYLTDLHAVNVTKFKKIKESREQQNDN